MAALTAYMAFTSRGKPFDIKIPNDPRALAAYRERREYFYSRRGQLNFSCASCHVQSPGEHIRTEVLAPALGILAAMPIYRSEWGGMGTISRRFVTCNSQVRGVPLKPQDENYRDVEYYLSYMATDCRFPGRERGREPEMTMRCFTMIALSSARGSRRLATAALRGHGRRLQCGLRQAQAAEKQAGALKNQWTTTEQGSRRRKRPPPPAISTTPIKHAPSRPRRWPKHQSRRPKNRQRPGRTPSSANLKRHRGVLRCDRRDVLQYLAAAALPASLPRIGLAADDDLYDIGRFGNARMLHLTDTHAQLAPVYFREPSVNIGVGAMRGQPPHLVGRAFLEHFGIAPGSRGAYAFTFLDYQEAAHRYGRMGGFAHLKTLIDRLRAKPAPAIRFCSTAATCGKAPARPTRCKAPTWSRPAICSASMP